MNEQAKPAMSPRDFEVLVRALMPDLYRYAVWLARDPGVAEEVVQEALLRAWQSIHKLREADSAKSWLLTIIRRENARWFQRQPDRAMDVDHVAAMDEALRTPAVDTDVLDIRRAIAGMAKEYREPLVLQVLVGLTAEEIAEVLEIKSGAVLTRLYRARKQLRDVLVKSATGALRRIDK